MQTIDLIADQRILVNVAATLRWTFVDSNGEPDVLTDGVDDVTVTVLRADGSTLVAAQAATIGDAGAVTYLLPAASNGFLDVLAASWTVNDVLSGTTTIAVVGAFWFNLAEVQALAGMKGTNIDKLLPVRAEVEGRGEKATAVAWVPRLHVAVVSGTGRESIVLPVKRLRRVRWVRVTDPTTLAVTEFDSDELAAIPADPDGIARRPSGDLWTAGSGNIEIGLECGYDRPSPAVKAAGLLATQYLLQRDSSGLSLRVTSKSTIEGGTETYSYAGDGGGVHREFGIPDVDAVLQANDHSNRGGFL